jgi:hypothetical protein
MKNIVAIAVFSLISISAANARDGARDTALIEPASFGSPYDYVVHARNTYAIGYNPEVKEDRRGMALRTVAGQCRKARIVGESIINTEMWGITSSFPDYILLVKCS